MVANQYFLYYFHNKIQVVQFTNDILHCQFEEIRHL